MNSPVILDALERIFWTAVQAFVGALLASPIFDQLGLGWQDSLKIAAAAAAVAVLKVVLAMAVTHNGTPQLGPETYEPKPPA